jgi:hypothetical protein
MEKIVRGLYPRTPKGGGEGGGEKKMGRIGEEGEGLQPPKNVCLSSPLSSAYKIMKLLNFGVSHLMKRVTDAKPFRFWRQRQNSQKSVSFGIKQKLETHFSAY